MGLMGTFMGGMVGFAFGGPIGGILGALIGGRLSQNAAGTSGMNTHQQEQTAYFVTTFSLLGKMAKADGTIDQRETALLDRIIENSLGLDPATKQFALQIFHKAAESHYGFEELARQFYGIFATRTEILESMLDLLTKMAMADGLISPREEEFLALSARIFGLDGNTYRHVKERHAPTINRYYAVLDCAPDASDAEIKKKYRQRAREFHPDTIVSKGLPEEFTKFAGDKFREIQEAYEYIKKERAMA
jgi:DnaJ like chaperone protein